MMVEPSWLWFNERRFEKWMIYRFLVGQLLSSLAVLIWCTSYLGRKAADISLSTEPASDKYHGIWGWLFGRKWFWCVPGLLVAIGVAFVGEALWGYLTTGKVKLDTSAGHWSRFVAMMVFFSVAAVLAVSKVVDYSLNLLADRLQYTRDHPTVDHPELGESA